MFQLYEIYNETKNENYELVIAVGGGSVLDVGKSLCCLYAKPVDSLETMRNMIAAKLTANRTASGLAFRQRQAPAAK